MRDAPRARFRPRWQPRRLASGLLDSWWVALALAALIHVGVALASLPASRGVGIPRDVSFSLLTGLPGGAGGSGGGATAQGDGGEVPFDPGAPMEVQLPADEEGEPLTADLIAPIDALDLPRGGDLPVRLPDRTRDRRAVVEGLRREERIEAALREARGGSPYGTGLSTGPGGGGIGQGTGGPGGDPELVRWKIAVESLFREAFHPLTPPGVQRVAFYLVDFDPDTGEVQTYAAHQSSGDPAYDAAVERAIRSVPVIPTPPPPYREAVGSRLLVDFHPPAG